LGGIPVVFPDYDSWSFPGGAVLAHRSVAAPVTAALAQHPTLYEWAARQPGRDIFHGRGETYGVQLGDSRVVVRHARRGGALAGLLGDRYVGAPRFVREIGIACRLSNSGVATPRVLVGVMYRRLLVHRADVATERVDGTDLFTMFFGKNPPQGEPRREIFRAVGTLVRKLHNAGFVHPDLQLRNVVVSPLASRLSPLAWLLDVDTCRPISPRDEQSRRANLARFERSWDKWNALQGRHLTDDDLAAFMDCYHERPA
jgi:3-deoxy-D-manno-octulosonic acid kinase